MMPINRDARFHYESLWALRGTDRVNEMYGDDTFSNGVITTCYRYCVVAGVLITAEYGKHYDIQMLI